MVFANILLSAMSLTSLTLAAECSAHSLGRVVILSVRDAGATLHADVVRFRCLRWLLWFVREVERQVVVFLLGIVGVDQVFAGVQCNA